MSGGALDNLIGWIHAMIPSHADECGCADLAAAIDALIIERVSAALEARDAAAAAIVAEAAALCICGHPRSDHRGADGCRATRPGISRPILCSCMEFTP